MEPFSTAASVLTIVGAISYTTDVLMSVKDGSNQLNELRTQLGMLTLVTEKAIEVVQVRGHYQSEHDMLVQIRSKLDNIQAALDAEKKPKTRIGLAKKAIKIKFVAQYSNIKNLSNSLTAIRNELHAVMLLLNLRVAFHNGHTAYTGLAPGSVERSSTFYPENYTVEQMLRQHFIVYSMVEVYHTGTSRIDQYHLLFLHERQWRRVIVVAVVSRSLQLSKISATRPGSHMTLPGMLQQQLAGLLQEADMCQTVNRVEIELKVDQQDRIGFEVKTSTISEDLEQASITDTSKFVADLRYRNLPQYSEREVVTVARESEQFIVQVGSTTCIEYKVPFQKVSERERQPFENVLEITNGIINAQGCSGIAKFHGIVIENHQFRSYLVQVPRRGRLFALMHCAQDEGTPIPWTRRERWFRQLLTTTSEIHKRGMTMNIHANYHSRIWVNADDNIEIIAFSQRTLESPNWGGMLPPEIRKNAKSGVTNVTYNSSFQSDIFDLGLVLWLLVQNVGPYPAVFCRGKSCERSKDWCTMDHTNPIALPACCSTKNNIPAYIDEIIRHCREELPAKRNTIAELIAMLSTERETTQITGSAEELDPWRRNDRYSQNMRCDKCGRHCPQEHYRCNLCLVGDLDLCAPCFSAGIRCYDEHHHTMVRRVSRNRLFVNEPLDSGCGKSP